jgi:hypothetical protein
MKKFIFMIFCCTFIVASGFSQPKAPYWTTGGEMIFSFASIQDQGKDVSSAIRWAPVFNIQSMLNKDLSDKFGLFTGLAVRNVGYIYDHYTEPATEIEYKKKFRSYNLALPVGVKIGNLNGMFIYGGYEIELPFVYKEKTFDASGTKLSKMTAWFSSREELFQHGPMLGIEFPYGFNVKFKYYLSEFHNQAYVNADGSKPYAGLKSNIWYFSLSYALFKNLDMEHY